jgi:uncharacterized protein YkwD
MKKITKIIIIAVIFAILAQITPVSAGDAAKLKSTEDEIVRLFNKAREKAGMDALEQDEKLTELARKKAEEMAENRLEAPDFPEGIRKFLKDNYAETRAQNCYSAINSKTPEEIVAIWAKHANFDRDTWAKEKMTHIGAGAAKGADGKIYYACIVTRTFGDKEKTALEDEVIKLINAEREKQGLKLLKRNDALAETARMKAEDMADNDYYDHKSPTYGSPSKMVKDYAKDVAYGGENIASGQKTANEVFKDWQNSPAHNALMMNKSVNCIGIGVAVDKTGNLVWSLLAGTKK